jgi:flagellar biosynthesis anti-sigma factor FlgM
MKINNIQNKLLNANLYKAAEKKPNDKEIKSKSGVNIEISDSAKKLIEKVNQSDDAKYSEKVEKIRLSILEGSYKVNTEDLAGKIMQAMDVQKDSDK